MAIKLLFVLSLFLQYVSNQRTICDHSCCTCNSANQTITCDCKYVEDLTLSPEIMENSQTHYNTLKICNCLNLHIISNWLSQESILTNIRIENIANLYLTPSSFYNPTKITKPLEVSFFNCSTQKIPSNTFSGNYRKIFLDRIRISLDIDSYAFMQFDKKLIEVVIQNSFIENITSQAFKDIDFDTLRISGNKINNIFGRTFTRITINKQFQFENNTIGSLLLAETFNFNDVFKPAVIEYNQNRFLNRIDSKAFVFNGHEAEVKFINNHFNELSDFVFFDITGQVDLLFYNNTITKFHKYSMNVTFSGNRRFELINVNQTCNCTNVAAWLRTYNRLAFGTCGFDIPPMKIGHYWEWHCMSSNQKILTWIYVIIVVILINVMATLYCLFKRKRRRYPIIVPDGRTYQQVEYQVVFDKVTPQKQISTEL